MGLTQSDKKLKVDGTFGMEWRKSTWLQSTIKSKSEQETKKADDSYFQALISKFKKKKKKKKKRRGPDEEEDKQELGVGGDSEKSIENGESLISSLLSKMPSSISCPISLPTEIPNIDLGQTGAIILILLIFVLVWMTLDVARQNTDLTFRLSTLERKLDDIILELKMTKLDYASLRNSCAQSSSLES